MRLYEMNMLKSDFLATMSHELRTPLNSILGFSEVLTASTRWTTSRNYVLNIQKSGKTLLEMINDILDLAKMESGKMEIRLTDFRVQQIIAAQADMARPLAEKKNIDLEISIEPDLPPMCQDQARVQQILNNLLSNAIKFTPEPARRPYLTAALHPRQAIRGDSVTTGCQNRVWRSTRSRARKLFGRPPALRPKRSAYGLAGLRFGSRPNNRNRTNKRDTSNELRQGTF